MRFCGLSLLLCLAMPVPALAQGLGDDAPSVARERYTIGRGLYRAGDYAGAAREFRVAFKLHPSSARLAYNLARSLERSEQYVPAIDAYEAYLRLAPKAADRGQVQEVVAALRELLPQQDEGKAEPEPAPKTGTVWPWVALGVGVAGAGAGAWFLYATNQDLDERDAAIDDQLGRRVVEGRGPPRDVHRRPSPRPGAPRGPRGLGHRGRSDVPPAVGGRGGRRRSIRVGLRVR